MNTVLDSRASAIEDAGQHGPGNPAINWLTLQFDEPELEVEFRHDYFHRSLPQMRLGLAVGLFLYVIFGALDPYIIPHATTIAWTMRYLVVCPFVAVVLVLTYSSAFERVMQSAAAGAGLVACIGIIVMIAAARPPGSYYYYAGLLLACSFVNTVMRVRFVPAALVTWATIALYESVAYPAVPGIIFINNTFFLVSINVVCGYACYFLERSVRVDFLQRRTIQQQAVQLQYVLQDVEVARRAAEEQSRRDPLTNLFNRRHYYEALELEVKSARRTHQPLAVIMLDLDHFKRINDTHGHATGDEVLCTVADQMVASLRCSDIPCRYGGEEFAICLVPSDAATARLTATRLLENIAASRVESPTGSLQITASIGIAVHDPDDTGVDTGRLVERADQALYAAKNAGRNRIIVWGEEQAAR